MKQNKIFVVSLVKITWMQTISISQIKSNPNNPRIIKDDKFAKLVKSIKEFPEMLNLRPIVVNSDMVVLGGNMRLKACKEAGLKEVPVIKADDLTEEQQKQFIIKDNVGFGVWDWDILANEWDSEELTEWGLDIPNFDVNDLGEAEEDDFDTTPPEIPKTVLGDLYEIGEHRLLCGDSTCSDTVAKLMNGNKADMVFTDPPYGVSYTNNMNDKHDVIMNDDVLLDFRPILDIFSKNNTHWYIWTSDPVYTKWRDMYSDVFKSTVIWSKGGGGIGDLKGDYARNYELCLFCQYGRRELNGKRDGGVWEIGKDSGSSYQHPTQKPIKLSSYGIQKSSNTFDIVLDLFLGSGSTMVAAHQLKRKCYGMELDPKYCDVIVNRMITLDPDLTVKLNGVDVTNDWK
jgi:DNA modification methylase